MRAKWFTQRAEHGDDLICWHIGRASAKRTVFVHVSVGLPVWWRPDAHRRTYSGITEWGFGWLLVAVQIAVRAA